MLRAENSVARRTIEGGPAPSTVKRRLKELGRAMKRGIRNGANWLTLALSDCRVRKRGVPRMRREVAADTAGGRASRENPGLEAANAKEGIRLTWDRPDKLRGRREDEGPRQLLDLARARKASRPKKIGDIQVHDEGRFQVQNTFNFIDGVDRSWARPITTR